MTQTWAEQTIDLLASDTRAMVRRCVHALRRDARAKRWAERRAFMEKFA